MQFIICFQKSKSDPDAYLHVHLRPGQLGGGTYSLYDRSYLILPNYSSYSSTWPYRLALDRLTYSPIDLQQEHDNSGNDN